MDFQENTTKIILAIIALFAVAGVVFNIRIRKKNNKTVDRKNLKNVNAGGDIVFGDKKTKINGKNS